MNRIINKINNLLCCLSDKTRYKGRARQLRKRSVTSRRWVPIFICYEIPCSQSEARVFAQGIAAKCPAINNSPVFTCIDQAKAHSQYLKQGSSVLKVMVPECRIIAVNASLKLRPILLHPESIAGYYANSVNQPSFIKNPNFNQKLFISSSR